MKSLFLILLAIAVCHAQTATVSLTPVSKLKLRNVTAEAVTFKGKAAVRLTDAGAPDPGDGKRLALIHGTDFADGTIEFDLAGDRIPGAPEGAKGFSGLAFRVSPDGAR
ncbi:MAG: hypothetical protein SGI92_03965 [Bryobacteraceae bacterium]|nr:hypothetical protein [Bryobacteraceae bacterium]